MIEVDGEDAAVTLLDTWDAEVREKHIFTNEERAHQPGQHTYSTLHLSSISLCVSVFKTDDEWAQECYMQTGDAYLLLYSITDRASFLRASELRITLRRFRPAQHTPIILVGNKCDLVRRREVSVSGKETQCLVVCVWWILFTGCCCFFHAVLFLFFFFQRAVPVLLCLTASLLKPQLPCSTMSGRPSTA